MCSKRVIRISEISSSFCEINTWRARTMLRINNTRECDTKMWERRMPTRWVTIFFCVQFVIRLIFALSGTIQTWTYAAYREFMMCLLLLFLFDDGRWCGRERAHNKISNFNRWVMFMRRDYFLKYYFILMINANKIQTIDSNLEIVQFASSSPERDSDHPDYYFRWTF